MPSTDVAQIRMRSSLEDIWKTFPHENAVEKMMAEKEHRLTTSVASINRSEVRSLRKRWQLPLIFVLLILHIPALVRHPIEISDASCSCDREGVEPLGSHSMLHPPTTFKYDGPQTTWTPWAHDFPCFPDEPDWNSISVQRRPSRKGFLFVREMKTASSTLSGVLLRLAHRRGLVVDGTRSGVETIPCRLRISHSSAREMKCYERDLKESFLLSLLRDPTKRAISHYFHFIISQQKHDPTDEHFKGYFLHEDSPWSGYYIKDLAMSTDDLPDNDSDSKDDFSVQQILSKYNFIAITERMEESLIVLKLLLGLEMEDILFMPAKRHGSFTTGVPPEHSCVYIVPPFLTPGMKEFFESQYWKNFTRVDQRLYDAAGQSLDNTIQALGRQKVQEELVIFRQALQYAHQRCEERTVYRCNSRGDFVDDNSTCYLWDVGCGYECLNEISISKDVLMR
jgi:hypothetical protein